MNDYGHRITGLLKAKGKTWVELSKETGISSSTLSHCKKINRFTTEQLEQIAASIGVSIAELLDFKDELKRVRLVELPKATAHEFIVELKEVYEKLGEAIRVLELSHKDESND